MVQFNCEANKNNFEIQHMAGREIGTCGCLEKGIVQFIPRKIVIAWLGLDTKTCVNNPP